MKTALILFLISFSVYAQEAQQILLNAITNCPKSTNPVNELKQSMGNAFGEAVLISDRSIEVVMLLDQQLLNPLIMTPVRILGMMRVEMTYPAPGYGLVCKTSVSN